MVRNSLRTAVSLRQLPIALLTWLGAAAIAVTSAAPWATRFASAYSFVVFAPMALAVNFFVALLAVATIAFMLSRSPSKTARALQRMGPALLLVAVALVVEAMSAANTTVPFGTFLHWAWFPIMWLAASTLGLAVARRPVVPLYVCAIAAWIAAVGCGLGLLAAKGIGISVVQWYMRMRAIFGGWTPAAGEPFRAVGFDVDPNYCGLLGAVVIAFVLGVEEHPRLRAFAAVGGAIVLVLSGSRTAGLSFVLIVLAWLATVLIERHSGRARLHNAAPVLLGVAAVVLAVAVTAAIAGSKLPIAERVSTSVRAASTESALSSRANALTGDRISKWKAAIDLYAQRPLGLFVRPEMLLGYSIHNDYLDSLVRGGPLLLVAYIAFLLWVAFLRPTGARWAGVTMSVAYASASMALAASYGPQLAALGFYLVGWMAGRPRAEEERT